LALSWLIYCAHAKKTICLIYLSLQGFLNLDQTKNCFWHKNFVWHYMEFIFDDLITYNVRQWETYVLFSTTQS
jgi:hypothetical protein